MAARSPKVDNDRRYAAEKVWLRCEAIRRLGEPRQVRVLDAYHGHGVLWDDVRRRMEPEGWAVRMFAVDKEKRRAGTLRGDNARVLASLDLSRFDVIDLDAYGWPIDQMIAVAERGQQAMVTVTRINATPSWTGPPERIMNDVGLEVPKDAPRDFWGMLTDYAWDAWLHHLGWRLSLRYLHTGTGSKCYELLLPPDTDPRTVAGYDTVDL